MIQFGELLTGDFEENTMTFEMPEGFIVIAGKYAIVPITEYEKLQQSNKNELLTVANGWIPFGGCNNVDFANAARNNCPIKFEDGTEVRYNDKWPSLALTHYKHTHP